MQPAADLVFTGSDDDPGTLETLAKLGFKDPATVSATDPQVALWQAMARRARLRLARI